MFHCSGRCHLAHASNGNTAKGSEHVGLDTGRRFKHKYATGTEQIHRNLEGKYNDYLDGSFFGLEANFRNHWLYFGVDLHRQEQPEASMRLHGVELLLQLHQPSWGQVDVLQHHPPATTNHFWIICSPNQGEDAKSPSWRTGLTCQT